MINIKIVNLIGGEIIGNSLQTLLQNIHKHQIDWMHACGAKGRCTTCKAVVVSGSEHLAPRTEAENRFANKNQLAENERLCCQTKIISESCDIALEAPRMYQLPHQNYRND